MKDQIEQRINENLDRVQNLIRIYETHLMGSGGGRRGHRETDVLRAATVFLHAATEDFLRGLAYWKLPDASSDVIDKIAIVGFEGNPKKFWLGELVKHKGKTIDTLIKESVNEHLDRSNYNNVAELSTFLESIGITITDVNSRFSDLEELMSRRHQIVHRADRDETGGRGVHRVRSIGRSSLRRWAEAVQEFTEAVLHEV